MTAMHIVFVRGDLSRRVSGVRLDSASPLSD